MSFATAAAVAGVFASILAAGCGPAGGGGTGDTGGPDATAVFDAPAPTVADAAVDAANPADARAPDPNAPDGGGGDLLCGTLRATIRDFNKRGQPSNSGLTGHPDFETFWGVEQTPDLVHATLTNGKPVFRSNPTSPRPGHSATQITSAASFAQWYNDTPGINMAVPFDVVMTEIEPGKWDYDNQEFFPVDGKGFNERTEGFGDPDGDGPSGPVSVGVHNYHFTTEIHTKFVYKAGAVFTFAGDDDLWLFINGNRVLDFGGLHQALTGTVNLDTLGLTVGDTYDMDIFHAERRTEKSRFHIQTTIDCFIPPVD